MIRVEEVRARIEAMVPDLSGRVLGAGRFADLMQRNAVPQQTPAAFGLPGQLAGTAPVAMAGAFIQPFTSSVHVVLAVRTANDPTGQAGLDEVTPLVAQVALAVMGWSPDDKCPGVFELGQGDPIGAHAGLLLYEITFQISDQTRIYA